MWHVCVMLMLMWHVCVAASWGNDSTVVCGGGGRFLLHGWVGGGGHMPIDYCATSYCATACLSAIHATHCLYLGLRV